MGQKRLLQAQAEDIRSIIKSNLWKLVYGISFVIGFFLFAIWGKEFAEENGLLSVEALRAVKDTMLDKAAFFRYVFWRRVLWLFLFVFAWWWGYGRWYIYGLFAFSGFAMGACLQTALLRYSVKGLTLWIFLYLPYAIFYGGAFFFAMLLCKKEQQELQGVRERGKRLQFLLQNILSIAGILLMTILGIYGEACVNPGLLRNYLQYF